jgi:hypothetical protein
MSEPGTHALNPEELMKAFIPGVVAVIVIVIAGAAALVSTSLDLSARNAYQAHDGRVRLSDR